MSIGTICLNCFHLKLTERGRRVRCSENKFREHLAPNHPFVTLPRDCPKIDDKEEYDDKEGDSQFATAGV